MQVNSTISSWLTGSGLVLKYDLRSTVGVYATPTSASVSNGDALNTDPYKHHVSPEVNDSPKVPIFAFGYPKIYIGEAQTLFQLQAEVLDEDTTFSPTVELKSLPVSGRS